MAELEKQGHDRKTTLGATLKRTFAEFKEDNMSDYAAGLTYYAVLSIFPALIAMVSIVGVFFDPTTVTRTLTDIVQSIAPEGAKALSGPIEQVTSNRKGAGIGLVVGVLLALSSASSYVGAFMRASNIMYEVDEGRPFWKLRPLQMLVTFIAVMLLAISALAVVATGPLASAIGSAIGLGDTAVTIFSIAKWPILLLVIAFLISLLFYAAPNAKLPGGFKFITVGGLVAVLVWVVLSLLFGLYVSNFGSYNKTYGTLGGIVGFLVWLWITNQAILFGAGLNAERERNRQIEAGTPGAEKDLKMRERDVPEGKERSKTA